MNTDVAGRVKNVQLPASRPLLPLFEAIINSIQAIEDAKEKNGKIEIEVVRANQELIKETEHSQAEINSFVVKDNGIGFDENNFDAFSTSDTTYKANRGGKGIGRFMWLAAFESVAVDSVFHDDGLVKRRQFTFCPRGSGIENPSCVKDAGAQRATTVRLVGFKQKYQKHCPKRLETIATFIVEEFLEFFIGPSCPLMTLRDGLTGESINLDDFYENEMAAKSSREAIKIKGQPFDVLHVRLYSSHINEHRLYLCAHGRVVTNEKIAGRVPNLLRRLQDETGKEFVYAVYAVSPVLDGAVNPDRTGFSLSDGESSQPQLIIEISLNDIREAVCNKSKLFLAPYTAPIAVKKRERIEKFVENDGAMYRPILKRVEHRIDAIDPEASNDEIDRNLYDAVHELRTKLRDEGEKLLQAKAPGDSDFAEFKKRFDDYFEQISEVSRADLARYVCHRKAILEFLKNQLALQDDGKYRREERIHSIIFPRGTTSDDVFFEDHNLWLVDERLAFHVFLSSDQTLKRAKALQNKSTKEPDVLVFDKAIAFRTHLKSRFRRLRLLSSRSRKELNIQKRKIRFCK